MSRLAIGLVVGIVLTGCGKGDDQDRSGTTASEAALPHAVHALCDAREAIDDSSGPSWRIFQNGAHDPLHELARQVTPKSRSVAASLLEAKQRVEVAFVKDMDPSSFRKLMTELLDASNAALEQLSLTVVECG